MCTKWSTSRGRTTPTTSTTSGCAESTRPAPPAGASAPRACRRTEPAASSGRPAVRSAAGAGGSSSARIPARAGPAPGQPRLHRSLRHAQRRRHLRHRQVGEMVQHHRLPGGWREPSQCGQQRHPVARQPWRGLPGDLHPPRPDQPIEHPPAPVPGAGHIQRRHPQPALRLLGVEKGPGRGQHPGERLPHRVLGPVAVKRRTGTDPGRSAVATRRKGCPVKNFGK